MPDTHIVTNVIYHYLPKTHAALFNGIIFGSPISRYSPLYTQLKTVGLVHLVVLSGMNITLLSTIIMVFTNKLNKKISLVLTIATIVAFILFVGVQPPIIRAGVMGVLTLVGILFGKKVITLYSLLLSAIFIGIFWPAWVTTISFQLSYAATLGLILFSKKQAQNEDKQTFFEEVKMYIKEELYTSLSAQVFTVPLIFLYFKQISFISPIANVLVSWLIAPLMIFGFITVILGKIHFVLGIIPAYICYALLSYIIFIVEILSKIPFAAIGI